MVRLPSYTADPRIIRTRKAHAPTLPTHKTGRNEHNATLRPSTPKLHDNTLKREDGAKRRCCRVHNGQRTSPGALTQREEPRRRLHEECGTHGRRRRWRQAQSFRSASHICHHEVARRSATRSGPWCLLQDLLPVDSCWAFKRRVL